MHNIQHNRQSIKGYDVNLLSINWMRYAMAMSEFPSKLSLPQVNPGVATVLDYLIQTFPYISADTWKQRMKDKKVHWHDGTLITAETPFQAQQRVYYYREVKNEPSIPFEETILFLDQDILVAYKPHFLPVTPGGQFVSECLQNRLRHRTGIKTLQAVHRLDRVTAGLVIFSVNPETCHDYHELFKQRKIQKTYQAVAKIDKKDKLIGQKWEIKNRIIKGKPSFRMEVAQGDANSHSNIQCIDQSSDLALFELVPVTGRTHQLRVHMQTLGWPILNDKYYPTLQALSDDKYSAPLQLLAKKLEFIDPVTQQARCFNYETGLTLNPPNS